MSNHVRYDSAIIATIEKEILEQVCSITDTLRRRIDLETGQVILGELNLPVEAARSLDKIITVACGTSIHAGLVGEFMIEALARIPVEVDYSSEFCCRDPIIGPDSLVLVIITQSEDNEGVLLAMEEVHHKGARLVSIVNVIGGMAQRVSDGYILMHPGPEIGVASIKAFTASLVDQLLLGAYLGQARGTLSAHESHALGLALAELPELAGRILEEGDHDYDTLAQEFHHREHFLFLGRGINYPIALEGALKLKEISHIHAGGYPAGEMEHGHMALVDGRTLVVTIAVQDNVYDKMVSQIEQVKTRGGIVIAVCNEGDEFIRGKADYVLTIPRAHPLITPILAVMPLQLLAYHLAVRRGCDVDQPRNLAKSVTVE
jgi:glucosamine--fructose-6-phosphate aminotransferase (isomerizing)